MGMTVGGGPTSIGTTTRFGLTWSGTGGSSPSGTVYLRVAVTGPGVNASSAWVAAGLISNGTGSGSASVNMSGFQPGGTYTYNVQGAVGSPGPAAYGSAPNNFTVPVDGGDGGGGSEPTNTPPTASLVSPASGAQLGTMTPDLTFRFNDPDSGENGQFKGYQIEVEQPPGTPHWDKSSVTVGSFTNPLTVRVDDPLDANVEARWRARVTDGAGATSAYTGWRTFTPVIAPNPPTMTLPASPVNTLTPLIRGTYNANPSGDPEDAWRYEVWISNTRIYDSGWIDSAIATGQTYGATNAGSTPAGTPPALQWDQAYRIRGKSRDTAANESDWSAFTTIQMNRRPTTPTGLQPSGGAVTGDPSPTLVWQHNDPDGDAQSRARIDLYEVATGTRVAGYPRVVEGSAQSHVVDAVLSTSPPTTYAFRVQTEGANGTAGYSDYSDPAEFIVASAPPVEITSPQPDDVLTAPSFTVTWNYEGDLGPQATWQVIVRDGLGNTVHDTGQTAGTDESYVVPSGVLRNLSPYTVTVHVTDTNGRPAQSSRVPFSTAFTPPATITGLSAVVIGGTQ